MSDAPQFRGGRNIALKVPFHLFAATVEAYRGLGIPVVHESTGAVSFTWGPSVLHVTAENVSQAELWLEFITPDSKAAARALATSPFVRCDAIEPLRPGFPGFWVTSPASIIHLVTEDE
jgi:hypothetical protein